MDALNTALAAYKPQLAANYSEFVTGLFSRMVAKFGPTLRGIGNDWDYAKMYRETVSPVLTWEGERPNDRVAKLDGTRLTTVANNYADATVEAWQGKITAKLADIENAEVRRLTGIGFSITGTRRGCKIVIEQHMIMNCSSKGTLFNQFPARIYVDGKFTSEAKYKKLFA